MFSQLIVSGSWGGLVAFVLAVPAFLLEVFEKGNVKDLPLLLDVRHAGGRRLSSFAVFLVALIVHVSLGFGFGILYSFFVGQMPEVIGQPYTPFSLAGFALVLWILVGGALLPVLRCGWFGKKLGQWVWLELFISFFLFGAGLWVAFRLSEPVYW
ncbi:MAG TPA: hypothetical protein VJB99_01840 [Patescibacteria group bacterium]|nr:hypothetical protein [Patescibacteria group bacterium]